MSINLARLILLPSHRIFASRHNNITYYLSVNFDMRRNVDNGKPIVFGRQRPSRETKRLNFQFKLMSHRIGAQLCAIRNLIKRSLTSFKTNSLVSLINL